MLRRAAVAALSLSGCGEPAAVPPPASAPVEEVPTAASKASAPEPPPHTGSDNPANRTFADEELAQAQAAVEAAIGELGAAGPPGRDGAASGDLAAGHRAVQQAVVALGLAFSAAPAPGRDATEIPAGTFERSVPAEAATPLEIATSGVDVEVIGGEVAAIAVSTELLAPARIGIAARGGVVRVELAGVDETTRGLGKVSVRVPPRARVRGWCRAGHLRASQLEGELELTARGGNVTVDASPASLVASTIEGDLWVVTAGARTTLRSVGGKIHVAGARGELSVATVDGPIEAVSVAPARLRIATLSGRIEVDADFDDRAGPYAITSHSGPVRVQIAPARTPAIGVSSVRGSVRDRLALPDRAAGADPARARVEVRSFSGPIVLRPRP